MMFTISGNPSDDIGEEFLWYEDPLNWGTFKLKSYSPDGGVFVDEQGNGHIDTHVLGVINPSDKFIERNNNE